MARLRTTPGMRERAPKVWEPVVQAGRDPVRQAKGLQNRAYRFAETGELIPYQVYVPSFTDSDSDGAAISSAS